MTHHINGANPYYLVSVAILLITIFISVTIKVNKIKVDKGVNMVAAAIAISGFTYLLLSERLELYD